MRYSNIEPDHEISAERTALADRIRELERRLIADDGR
jgi:hypothetical protein